MRNEERRAMLTVVRRALGSAYREEPRDEAAVTMLEVRLQVLRAGIALDAAVEARDVALVQAHAAGVALRELAALADLSPEGVRKIIQRRREVAA